ncbi:MAG: AAC(3) family N-acetyltransferase [Armatimonadota bacterium]
MSTGGTEGAKMSVTKREIIQGLHALGLTEGDLVQVHSSLSSFGHAEGGADTVVDALLESVGPDGTVMMPTFNHGSEDIFDIRTSPSTNGAITNALRLRPEARRSLHPTHPTAAIGPLAQLLTRDHLPAGTFGIASPLGKLAAMGGKVLLLGVGMNTNTMAHIGETLYGVPCFIEGWPRLIVDGLGHVARAQGLYWRNGPCRVEWEALEAHLRERGQISDGQISNALVHLMLGAHVVGATVRLCQTLCPNCPTRPRMAD